MTNEEVERAIELLVKQQGQFSSDMERVGENLGTVERNLGTAVNLLSDLTKTQIQMAEAQILTEKRVADLAAAQKRTEEALGETNHALAETNDRLNSLIVVVERYFSNGRRDN